MWVLNCIRLFNLLVKIINHCWYLYCYCTNISFKVNRFKVIKIFIFLNLNNATSASPFGFLFCFYSLFKISEAYISETCTVITPKPRRSFQQSVETYYSQLKCSGTYPTSSKTTNIQIEQQTKSISIHRVLNWSE